MKKPALVPLVLAVLLASAAQAAELVGPGRFCGYSPIIDLLPGEKVTTLQGGIHGGGFRWEGAFGVFDVFGMGLAGRPEGRIVRAQSGTRPARFKPRRKDGRHEVAIWNGGHGAAYFRSPKPFTTLQLEAIDRVSLFEEGQTPADCKLRTTFSWD